MNLSDFWTVPWYVWLALAFGTASWWWTWEGKDSPRVQEFQIAIGTFLIRIWRSITRRTE